jgi:outer membrane protein
MLRCRVPGGLLLLATVALVGSSAAEGPTPAPPLPNRFSVIPDQWQRGVPPSPAMEVPAVITRDPEVQRVTLREAIAIALENNPGIAAQRLEPTRVEQSVLEAQGQYDPILGGHAIWQRTTTPNPSQLAGTLTSDIDDRNLDVNLGKLFRTGTQFTLDTSADRLDNNARYYALRPQYTSNLGFSVVQPLLRDFGWDFSYLVVRIAEQNAGAAASQYEANLADFVQQVVEAYWNVVRARENVESLREAKALADRTVQENQARVDVGLLPPVSVLEAQADAKSRETDLILGENTLDVNRQTLAQLCFYRPSGTFVPRTLEPADEPVAEDVPVAVEPALETAMAERPEIAASKQGVQARQIQERIAGNQLLPRVDVVGGYGVNGLSGHTNTNTLASGPFLSSRDLGGCTFLSTGLYACPAGSRPPVLTSAYEGPEEKAWNRAFTGDFTSYSFGVQLSVPLDDATAKGQYTRSVIERDQAQLNHRQLLSQVTLEVRQSIADVVTSRQRIETSRVARELAEENLRNQTKRHEVGMATTKDLLDYQTRLTVARFQEVNARVDHAIAIARWRRAQGRLLPYFSILIERPGERTTPWFAKF